MVHTHTRVAAAVLPRAPVAAAKPVTVARLGFGHEAEALAFLAARPVHTVMMSDLISDNGLESPLNRGAFYGCRGADGSLEGVALIGHYILFEARSDEAVEAFGTLARECPQAHLILAEAEMVARFWEHYAEDGLRPRAVNRERLLELSWPVEVREPVPELRCAVADDIELVIPAHVEMALAESGVNPLEADPEGFRRRLLRRIERGRVYIWVEGARLLFKADVASRSPEATYLEGVYVDPESRGKGYGLRCLSQLAMTLLSSTGAVTLLVNELNVGAQRFYRRAGFRPRGCYDTVYLQH